MSDRPVLFLDIDGVLNCETYYRRHYAEKGRATKPRSVCADRVALLNLIVARTNCRITVSSTWRMDSRCRRQLRDLGVKAKFSREWRTPWMRSDNPDLVRGDEIADWLSRHPGTIYAIVDDDSDMLDNQVERFVQTTYLDGLTEAHADRLVELLTSPSPTHVRRGGDRAEARR